MAARRRRPGRRNRVRPPRRRSGLRDRQLPVRRRAVPQGDDGAVGVLAEIPAERYRPAQPLLRGAGDGARRGVPRPEEVRRLHRLAVLYAGRGAQHVPRSEWRKPVSRSPRPASRTQGRWYDVAGTLGSGVDVDLRVGYALHGSQAEYSVELLDGNSFSFINVSAKNGLRLPAYHRLDLSARYRFSLGDYDGDLGISVFNAYDRPNVWYRQFELDATPAIVTDVNYVGRVLNLSVRFNR
ncbi:MAG: TonB-dependent receptor [Gemmatimonadetes bacterium]|nr:TonB-dependent receptor [Gemmatimonadota bacterium]